MNTVSSDLESPIKTDRFVCLLAGARSLADVVAAVRDYLAAWSPALIAHLQTVDAGWAPFDENRKPMPVNRPEDLRESFAAVHGQCLALRGAGVTVAAELLELDLFLYFACARLAELEPKVATAPGTAPYCSFERAA
ncbi:MAG: hypothetical protein ABI423_08380 [Burkholderiales bacterium]